MLIIVRVVSSSVNWTLALAVTSELLFSQKKEGEEQERDSLMQLLNSDRSVVLAVSTTLEISAIRKENETMLGVTDYLSNKTICVNNIWLNMSVQL